jgi:hypothetical protein
VEEELREAEEERATPLNKETAKGRSNSNQLQA